jgi:WD40 repeat protein
MPTNPNITKFTPYGSHTQLLNGSLIFMLLSSTVLLALCHVTFGELFSVGDNGKQLREFDDATSALINSYTGQTATVVDQDYSLGGFVLASITYNGEIRLYSVQTQKLLFPTVQMPSGVTTPSISFSKNNRVLGVYGQHAIQIDVSTGKIVSDSYIPYPVQLNGGAYSPGNFAVCCTVYHHIFLL